MIRNTKIIAAVVVALASTPATALTLKSRVTAGSDVVRLGDIFADGGEHTSVALFHAPAPGMRGTVRITRLRQAVSQLGIAWSPPPGLDRITVTRPHKAQLSTIPMTQIEKRLREALANSLPGADTAEDIAVTLAARTGQIPLLANGTHKVDIIRLDIDPRSETFQAEVEVTVQDQQAQHMLSGSYESYVQVPVLAVGISRGEIIGPEHLTSVRTRRADAASATTLNEVVGMAARRRLRAGVSLRLADIQPPKVVTRNELVTITFQMPGIMLTTQGRALEDGARGETVSVRNINSNRVIQAVAETQGRVSVAAPRPAQLAMR